MSEGMKTCIDCRRRLPVDRFYRVHRGSEARQSRCRDCDNAKRVQNSRSKDGRVVGRSRALVQFVNGRPFLFADDLRPERVDEVRRVAEMASGVVRVVEVEWRVVR